MTTDTALELDAERARRFSARLRIAFATLDLFLCALLLVGVFVALPDRYAPVDVASSLLVLLLLASTFGILRRTTWSEKVFRVVAFVQLAVGLLLTFTAIGTASYLSGIYGPIGRGGSVILALVAALALPYLVVLPAMKLLWIGPPPKLAAAKATAPAAKATAPAAETETETETEPETEPAAS
jgi:hypothetical protein